MMAAAKQLSREFFNRHTLEVAYDLIGKYLVRLDKGERLCGIIIETEAYRGEEDLGCHAHVGRTKRNNVMYGLPGHAYVYFTYGMHWMLNFVCEKEGYPAAVLIRAIQIIEGKEVVYARRNSQPTSKWTDGPAKICQALNINGELNGYDICQPNAVLFVELNSKKSPINYLVTKSARVGLYTVQEPWKSISWRFKAKI